MEAALGMARAKKLIPKGEARLGHEFRPLVPPRSCGCCRSTSAPTTATRWSARFATSGEMRLDASAAILRVDRRHPIDPRHWSA